MADLKPTRGFHGNSEGSLRERDAIGGAASEKLTMALVRIVEYEECMVRRPEEALPTRGKKTSWVEIEGQGIQARDTMR